jgi:hypothetical protein
VHKADNLTTVCEQLLRKCEIPVFSQPYGLPRPVTGIALPILLPKKALYLIMVNLLALFFLQSKKKVNKAIPVTGREGL